MAAFPLINYLITMVGGSTTFISDDVGINLIHEAKIQKKYSTLYIMLKDTSVELLRALHRQRRNTRLLLNLK
jgi:hypothetical protein